MLLKADQSVNRGRAIAWFDRAIWQRCRHHAGAQYRGSESGFVDLMNKESKNGWA